MISGLITRREHGDEIDNDDDAVKEARSM